MLLTEKYSDLIEGSISCYDRVVLQGTLPGICYASGMTAYLNTHNIRIFDYPRFAEPLRDQIRENAEKIAREHQIEIEFLRKSNIRKEKRISDILHKRGHASGLVHIFSAMESCPSYKPWHDKQTHQTYLKPIQAKCLHYYFYLIDPQLGLCYIRVPTWCPFRLQIYFNGHSRLAYQLQQKGLKYTLLDNAFTHIADTLQAQQLSDELSVASIHDQLDAFARRFCPVIQHFNQRYHWSIMQIEYATDIVFKRQSDLQSIYDHLTRTAIHTVKPENIATFLGRKLHPNYQDEMGNAFNTRIQGTRIKHSMGPVAIKMYDKFGLILRIETTVNDVSFFKHYRKVEHRDGSTSNKLAAMKKGIYSIVPLQTLLYASNRRYLQFISDISDVRVGIKMLNKITRPVVARNRPYKGFNFFNDDDQKLLEVIASGEFNISGFQNKHLQQRFPGKTSAQMSRIIKRLRTHRLIKKIAHTYKYYLTRFGQKVITMGLKLKELVIIPELSGAL
jgi:hypothetical protein